MDLIERLEKTRTETLERFGLGKEELSRRYGTGKWTVREVLHHLADAETVLFDRIRRVISKPGQVIWAFDQDAWARELGYATDRPLSLSRDLYEATRAAVVHYARLHWEGSDRVWFVHSETGLRTLRDELEKVAEHNRHHLEQIRTAVGDDD